MIVCSCNVITKSEIEEVVRDFLEKDAWQLITVGMVYHAMEKRGKCCGCFPNAIGVIVDYSARWHHQSQTPSADIIDFVGRIRAEHERCETFKKLNSKRKVARHAA